MNRKSLREFIVLTLLLSTFSNSHSQVRSHTLNKISPDKIKIDGIITEEEIGASKIFNLDNEISPGYNIPSNYKTLGYISYTSKFLYVGYRAYRDQVKTSVLPRDDFKMFSSGQDMVSIQID